MNELPTSPDVNPSTQSSSADAVSPPISKAPSASRRRDWLAYVLFGLLAILLALHWWTSQQEDRQVREDVAQRLRVAETSAAENRTVMKSLQDGMKELQAKVNVLEGKQIEAQSQQVALEQMYQDFSKNRDDWALAEIEQVLSTASQQLQIAGNVQGAVIALQNADARLSLSDQPQFTLVRRAIASDLEKLKAVPEVDLAGIAMRLDSVIGQVDAMPLLSDEKPALAATQPKPQRHIEPSDATEAGWSSNWLGKLENLWQSWSSEIWAEIRQLIRVRDVNTSEALLLSPSQAYFVRENLKLRLLNARLALLARNESAFRSDLIAAQDLVAKYFDTRAKQTQTVQALLRQVQASDLAVEMPTLTDSLNAVRNYKAKP